LLKAKAKDFTHKAKAKDLILKAKAKDSKFVLEDTSRPRPRTTTLFKLPGHEPNVLVNSGFQI